MRIELEITSPNNITERFNVYSTRIEDVNIIEVIKNFKKSKEEEIKIESPGKLPFSFINLHSLNI